MRSIHRFTFVNDYARKLLGINTERWVAEPAISGLKMFIPMTASAPANTLRAAQFAPGRPTRPNTA